jgi:hypothetical protein
MIALDLPSAIYWWSCTYREWSPTPAPSHPRGRLDDPVSDRSISCKSHELNQRWD